MGVVGWGVAGCAESAGADAGVYPCLTNPAALQAAEDEKMAQFRALLNQGPITIARRQ